MAVNLNESIFEHKIDIPLDPAYTGPLESGMVMVASANIGAGGEQLARPCEGLVATEVILGVLKLSENSQESVPMIEALDLAAEQAVPVASTVTLRELPASATDIRAHRLVAGVVTPVPLVIAPVVPVAGELQVNLATGLVTTIAGLDSLKGQTIFFTYRFLISAAELARRGGRRSVNMGAERVYQQVTIMRGDCKLLLSNFVVDQATPAFAPSVAVLTAPSGKVRIGGAGTPVGTCFQAPVMKLTPGIEQAFIGLEASLGG